MYAYEKQAEVCIEVLSQSFTLANVGEQPGQWKPSSRQLGFCVGFCDVLCQRLGLSDEEFLGFVFKVFLPLFGDSTDNYFKEYVAREAELRAYMIEGGNAFLRYVRDEAAPVFPLGD